MNDQLRAEMNARLAQKHMSRADLARAVGKTPQEITRALNGGKSGGSVPPLWAAMLEALDVELTLRPRATSPAPQPVLTVGVNDWGADGRAAMLEALKAAGVSHLWDVRDSTTSPNPKMQGWAKSNLDAACKAAGVEYLSRRDLGVPKLLRAELTAPEVSDRERQEKYAALLEERGVKLEDVQAEMVGDGGAALLCSCKSDGRPCHRFILAELLGLPVENLTPGAARSDAES